VEVYYEWIRKLINGLQIQNTNNFLTTMFQIGLQSYIIIVTIGMN